MAKLIPKRTVRSLDQLLKAYNSFVNDMVYSLNRRFTFTENFDSIVRTVELDGTFPVKTTWDRLNPPKALWVGNITRSDKVATGLSAGFVVEWEFIDGQINIINTPGLTPSSTNKYQLTFIAVSG